jgi:hypothetical protein
VGAAGIEVQEHLGFAVAVQIQDLERLLTRFASREKVGVSAEAFLEGRRSLPGDRQAPGRAENRAVSRGLAGDLGVDGAEL